jgi:acyl-CoA thioesterase FadM
MQGQAFVVSQHEIRYLRPVTYNELVGIQSALIGWGDSWLEVEMCMFVEEIDMGKGLSYRIEMLRP